MKNLLKLFSVLMLMTMSAGQLSAQIKHGDATVTQGSTTTVYLADAYVRTLMQSTGVSATWSVGSSAISIQSRTNTSCTIKGNTAGTAKLYYRCSYFIDGFYRTMNFYYDITIKSNVIYVTRIEMSPSSATMEVGETLQLNATAYPVNATNRSLNWSTDKYSVASVSSSGVVTARGAGRVWIWAHAKDGSGAGNYCVIDVKEPEQHWLSVVLPNGNFAINVTDMEQVKVKVTPDEGYAINSVTLDGEEQSHDDGDIILPKLNRNATLNVVFVSGDVTKVDAVADGSGHMKVTVSDNAVTVNGLSEYENIYVYDSNGALIMVSDENSFELPSAGIYILRIGDKSFKLAIR